MTCKAVFLDKDGTLVEDVPYNVDPDRIVLTVGAREGLQRLHKAGYALIVITNQAGVARGYFPPEALMGVQQRLQTLLGDIPLAGFYYCPHHPDGVVLPYSIACHCRKPQPGLLQRAAAEQAIDLAQSWFIGDILHDIEAGRRAGCRTILLDNGNETEWELSRSRLPHHVVSNLVEAAQIITTLQTVTKSLEARQMEFPQHTAFSLPRENRGDRCKAWATNIAQIDPSGQSLNPP